MSWVEVAVVQQFGSGRDLVTYPMASWPSSSTPDGPLAIGGRARHARSLGKSLGSPVCLTNGVGSQPCLLCDIPAWCKTVDAIGSGRWDPTTACNANTHADRTWPPAMVKHHQTARQTREASPAQSPNKTEENKRRKLFSELFRRRRIRIRRGK